MIIGISFREEVAKNGPYSSTYTTLAGSKGSVCVCVCVCVCVREREREIEEEKTYTQ